MSIERLLDLRLCDLGVRIEGSILERRVKRLQQELDARDLLVRPHTWLSSEWFSPDGVPGIALPFYLAHPRLMKLEDQMMFEVEGGSERQCMRLLRHEMGHVMCTAYRLYHKPSWQKVFGSVTEPYPETYKPRPQSRHYVFHLDWWYAQAHPAEDFAETFAVWLRPRSGWRTTYKGWPAIKKLEYVDQLMHDLAGQTPPVRSRRKIEPLSELRMTLREHYEAKRRRYADDWPDFFDRDLRRLFSDDPKYAKHITAAAFLRSARPDIRQIVAEWTGVYTYTIDQVLRDMIDRCMELRLRLARPYREARTQAMVMVAVRTMNYLHGGNFRFAL